jgi:hypothetical protein
VTHGSNIDKVCWVRRIANDWSKPSPLLFKEGWLRLNKKIPFLSGADGVVSNFKQNKERYASIYKEATRPFLLTRG